MAQWVPKTAWRISNINKQYGVGHVGLETGAVAKNTAPVPFLAATAQPTRAVWGDAGSSGGASEAALLQRLYRRGAPFIDLRDADEAARFPLRNAVALHHHDLLSGACCDVLPADKDGAELVIFASGRQRAVNGFNALRRWGYHNVVVTDFDAVKALDAAAGAR
jgi:hypothetical protein